MEYEKAIEEAKERFGRLVREQIERVERLRKDDDDPINYTTLSPIIIGVVPGDGIGPSICSQATRILKLMLRETLAAGKVKIRTIEGLTIENRAKTMKAIPDDVMNELMQCHVILKGPTTTPRKGDGWPNIESANVAMRRELDLFANIRPVKIPEQDIEWVFFRENSEGAYILGNQGINVTDDLAMDFTITTGQGSRRILEMAFEYAQTHNMGRVTVVTKANVIKTTDGKFLDIAKDIARRYPDIEWDDWYIDIMTAKLIDTARRNHFKVVVLPNLYGDIITDEAAQIQGGVGTAGSANIGKRYAMFEAIHGSAPRMVEEGRAMYADPQSMVRAVVMLLSHIGFKKESNKLEMVLDICGVYERNIIITGRTDGATGEEFTDYLIDTLGDSGLNEKWDHYTKQVNKK
jgi:isocitrate dehydrogenase (NAD+)